MTVGTELCRSVHDWTGVETFFNTGYPADRAADVLVYFRAPDGTSTQLTAGVNHTVALAGANKIATVTPIAIPGSAGKLVTVRDTPALVNEVLQDGEGYSIAIVQQLFDRDAMRGAEQRRDAERSIVLRPTDEFGSGAFDLLGTRMTNLAAGQQPNDAATVAQLQGIGGASGNVPSPVISQVGYALFALSPGVFGWQQLPGIGDGSIGTLKLADGALSADAPGRAKMADGFLVTAKLADGALSANAAGLGKMADGYFSADAAGRAKMADNFITSAELDATAIGARTGLLNGIMVQTRAGNAETFAVKTLAGADPSSGDPVVFVFQDGTGGYVRRRVTSALSVTASSGSTLGAANGVPFRIWCVAADDAGTVRLALVNVRLAKSIMGLSEVQPLTSSAEGGAGAADNAQALYSDVAFASRYCCIVGYADWNAGLAAAGTWNTAPSRAVLFGPGVPRPGERVQLAATEKTDTFTSTVTGSLQDITGLSVAITPQSAANLIRAVPRVQGQFDTAGNGGSFALVRNGTVVGGGTAAGSRGSGFGGWARTTDGNSSHVATAEIYDAPGAIGQQTYKIQFVIQSGAAIYVNRTANDTDVAGFARTSSSLVLEEIMA